MPLPPAAARRLAALLGVEGGTQPASVQQDVADALALTPSSLPSASYSNRPPTNIGTAQLADGAVTAAKQAAGSVSVPMATGTTDSSTAAVGSTRWLPIGTVSASMPSTELTVVWIAPVACKLRNLRMRNRGAIASGNTLTLTLRKNGVDTSLVVSWASGTAADSDAADTTNTVDVAAGDRITIRMSLAGAGANTAMGAYGGIECATGG